MLDNDIRDIHIRCDIWYGIRECTYNNISNNSVSIRNCSLLNGLYRNMHSTKYLQLPCIKGEVSVHLTFYMLHIKPRSNGLLRHIKIILQFVGVFDAIIQCVAVNIFTHGNIEFNIAAKYREHQTHKRHIVYL